jgi:alpha-tubulin suppressor-like RCC1 family protein
MRTRRYLAAATFACAALIATPAAGAQVMRWGTYFGGGGEGGGFTQPLPTAVPGLEEGVVALAASNSASYALKGGAVFAFGDGGAGELGDGSTKASPTTPVQVSFPAGVSVVSIGEAKNTGFAIDATGQGWAWGGGEQGDLCLGKPATKKVLTPEKVPGITDAVAVAGGQNHVLWLLADGTVAACGTNEEGQLGVGESVGKSTTPVKVPGLSGVVEISAGNVTSAAREASGAVYMWGGDEAGQIGTGTEAEGVFEPFHVPLPGPASEVSAGGDLGSNGHSLALVRGEVFGWGADNSGQIGDGVKANKLTPVDTGLKFSTVVASGACSLGLSGGELWAWGGNSGQALGTGAAGRQPDPGLVAGGVSMISGTAMNSLAG